MNKFILVPIEEYKSLKENGFPEETEKSTSSVNNDIIIKSDSEKISKTTGDKSINPTDKSNKRTEKDRALPPPGIPEKRRKSKLSIQKGDGARNGSKPNWRKEWSTKF